MEGCQKANLEQGHGMWTRERFYKVSTGNVKTWQQRHLTNTTYSNSNGKGKSGRILAGVAFGV